MLGMTASFSAQIHEFHQLIETQSLAVFLGISRHQNATLLIDGHSRIYWWAKNCTQSQDLKTFVDKLWSFLSFQLNRLAMFRSANERVLTSRCKLFRQTKQTLESSFRLFRDFRTWDWFLLASKTKTNLLKQGDHLFTYQKLKPSQKAGK